MKKIAVFAAMAEELAVLRNKVSLKNRYQQGKTIIEQVSYQNKDLLLVESGIGKVNAAIATTILLEKYAPDLIINIGSAGGVKEHLNIGDVVVGSEFVYADVDVTCFGYAKGQLPKMPEKFIVSPPLLQQVMQIVKQQSFEFQVDFGQILTSDAFIDDPQLQQKRTQDFPDGYVVEMESAAVAHSASFYNVDVLVFRALSDIAGKKAAKSFTENLAVATNSSTKFLQVLLNSLLA